jgi:nucleotide-binding universal stress UspA family protein
LKTLLAYDGSPHSDMATKMLMALPLPPQAEVNVITVVPQHTFLGGITLDSLTQTKVGRVTSHKAEEQRGIRLLRKPVETLKAPGYTVNTSVCWGRPAEQILKTTCAMPADLVAIGARGHVESDRFPLGDVAHKVMKYAGCSVLLAKEPVDTIRRVLLATDGSEYSAAAAQYLLELPLTPKAEVFLLAVLESRIAAWMKTPTLNLERNQDLLAELQQAEEKEARKLLNETRKPFREGGYRVSTLVLKGEPAEEILLAASTLNPELIVLGVKGLTGIERFLLGSVAQRVARFSPYSVLIVKRRPGLGRPPSAGSQVRKRSR